MLSNYLKTATRNLTKNKIHSIINLVGLSVGIGCCLLISMYVYEELSYDRYRTNHERIFRIPLERIYPDHTRDFASSSVMLAPVLMQNYPEVEVATRLHRLFFVPEISVTIEDQSFQESRFRFADSLFFDVFETDFIEGNPATALDEPNGVVLTRETAERYFNSTDVLGNTFESTLGELQVTGVIEDLPDNTHMHFDLLGSITGIGYLDNAIETNNWTSPWLYTYVKLQEGSDLDQFQEKLDDIVETYGAASLETEVGMSIDDYVNSGHQYNYYLQPITSIHLHSDLDVELEANSNINYVYMLIMIVGFILLISCINFVNLSTARSGERAREVGVRKVLGSTRKGLINQFLAEAVLLSITSLLISIVLAWMVLPVFNEMVGKSLTISALGNPIAIGSLLLFAIALGLTAGLYPSLIISSIQAASVLKGDFKGSKKGIWLRNALVIFQFFISIVLVSGVLMVGRQLDFIRSKDLGFNKENILVLKQAGQLDQQYTSFINEIKTIPQVEDAGGTFTMPGDFFGSNLYTPDDPDLSVLRANILTVDDDFVRTMGMDVVEGRSFEPEFNDSLSIMINEAALNVLGYKDPIGRTLTPVVRGDNLSPTLTIVGVLKDFNFESLHKEVYPLVIGNGPSQFTPGQIAIRLNPGDPSETIEEIRTKWVAQTESQEMVYSFFDSDLDQLYVSEQTSKRIFNAFTSIAIIMACVGLFGLTTFMAQQRMKEIGIRKVMGASVSGIMLMLSTELSKLIMLALIIAIPMAYFAIDWWLGSFAFRVDIGIDVFLLAGFGTFVLAWTTISYQSIKSALMNPIKSIRND